MQGTVIPLRRDDGDMAEIRPIQSSRINKDRVERFRRLGRTIVEKEEEFKGLVDKVNEAEGGDRKYAALIDARDAARHILRLHSNLPNNAVRIGHWRSVVNNIDGKISATNASLGKAEVVRAIKDRQHLLSQLVAKADEKLITQDEKMSGEEGVTIWERYIAIRAARNMAVILGELHRGAGNVEQRLESMRTSRDLDFRLRNLRDMVVAEAINSRDRFSSQKALLQELMREQGKYGKWFRP